MLPLLGRRRRIQMQSVQPCPCLHQVALTQKMGLEEKKGIPVSMGGIKKGGEEMKTV